MIATENTPALFQGFTENGVVRGAGGFKIMRGKELVAFGGLDTTTGDDWFSKGAKLLAQGIANKQTNQADSEPVTLTFQKQVMQGGEKVWVENLSDQEST